MSMDLNGKTAVVTGGARDIGRSISLALAEAGAAVVVNYNASREAAESVVEDILRRGGRALAVGADVSKQAGARALIAESAKAFGKIDVLVNNAGGMIARKKLDEMDEAFWDQV